MGTLWEVKYQKIEKRLPGMLEILKPDRSNMNVVYEEVIAKPPGAPATTPARVVATNTDLCMNEHRKDGISGL